MLTSIILALSIPFALSSFTQNLCFTGWTAVLGYAVTSGCIQKGNNSRFCYYPSEAGTLGSCNMFPSFIPPMTAHLAQGQTIAYYGPDGSFFGGVDFPYPANGGITYLCISGAVPNGLFQTTCSIPGGDNVVIGNSGFCTIGLPMTHVDDGCYIVPAVPDTTTTSPNGSLSPSSSSTTARSSSLPSNLSTFAYPSASPGASMSATPAPNSTRGLSKSATAGVAISVVVAVIGLLTAIFTFLTAQRTSRITQGNVAVASQQPVDVRKTPKSFV